MTVHDELTSDAKPKISGSGVVSYKLVGDNIDITVNARYSRN